MFLELTPVGIERAYRLGIFPMYDEDTGDILWFQPDPRAILPLNGFHTSRSLRKVLRQGRFEIRYDYDFEAVMRACADREEGVWISEEFVQVYAALHRRGKAHCVEAWREGRLVGGVYGVALGGAFMAESMFHFETNASKVALSALVSHLNAQGYALLDVQFLTPHLASLGAIEISHRDYMLRLARAAQLPCRFVEVDGNP